MYPDAKDPEKIGTFSARSYAGGGYVWDEVLEYRVWCSPRNEAEDLENGNDYYYVFAKYVKAVEFSRSTKGADPPIALILQKEYIDEPETGCYIHVKQERITEWPVEFLTRPKRSDNTIPDFMSSDAPENKLDIIRGLL